MIPFFKRKTTASEIAMALLQVPLSGIRSPNLNLLETSLIDAEHKQRVLDEIVYLFAFVVDFATNMSLGSNSPEKKVVLDVYYFNLQEMAKKGEFCADFYENLCSKRLPIYTNAIRTSQPNEADWTGGVAFKEAALAVGAAFAELCGYYMDLQRTMLGSILFF